MRAAHRIRRLANLANGSTGLGLLLARAGGARVRRGPDGLLIAAGFRPPLPVPVRTAPAFTVGNVVVVRDLELLARRPALLGHEARHATQYAWCLGPALLPMYVIAAGWSWLRYGDFASGNVFERRAGLAEGGYRPRGAVSGRRAWRSGRRAARPRRPDRRRRDRPAPRPR